MRVIEPTRFDHRTKKKTKKRSRHAFRALFVLFVVAVLVAVGAMRFLSPEQYIKNVTKTSSVPGKQVNLAWPSYGQAAVGARGYKVLAQNGPNKPLPTASIAKTMTAFAVLREYPLALGEQGPTITLTTKDVQMYNDYIAKDGSTVAVQAGEQITEYQALQALLLPSANNIADTLAIWAFGSLEAYVDYANGLARTLGLENTHFADASGFSSDTVSTAYDLVLLGESVLMNDVMAEIVSQQSAVIPVAGTIRNVNFALGVEGINGIKTGNTEEAGGCFLVSAAHTFPDGQKIVAVAAIQGAPNLYTALQDTLPLLQSMYKNFGYVPILNANETVGTFDVPWQGKLEARAKERLDVFTWLGSDVKTIVHLDDLLAPVSSGAVVGRITVNSGIFEHKTDAILSGEITRPTTNWRVKDIFEVWRR